MVIGLVLTLILPFSILAIAIRTSICVSGGRGENRRSFGSGGVGSA